MNPLIPLFLCLVLLPAGSAQAQRRIVVKGLLPGMAVVSLDGREVVLKKGQKAVEGLRLIDADSRKAVIEVDGIRGTYRLNEQIGGGFTPAPEKARVRVWPDASGMYMVSGSINGFPVDFLVDTGATLIAMNEAQARRLGIDYKLEGKPGHTSTASGIAQTWYVVLREVRVGDIRLENVPAAVIKGSHPSEVLLGNSFLNRLKMERHGQALELIQR
ncbi:MAG: TIGR02281 family clan AA aspartic protease [Gammaproteobacteria bacterium]|nr:MAG: TIGR02281 family clan AA aspartic protease [Gammaproteobacteria bacterium]